MKSTQKFLLLLFCLNFLPDKSRAQTHETRLGFIAGGGITDLKIEGHGRWYDHYGYSGGAFFQYRLKPKLALELDLLYECKNYTILTPLYDYSGFHYASYWQRNSFNFASLPVMLSWNGTGRTRLIFNTGAYLNYLAFHNSIVPNYSNEQAWKKKPVVVDPERRLEYGLVIGLGFCRQISKRTSVQFELRNSIGLKNMSASASGQTLYLNYYRLLFALSYKLGKIETDEIEVKSL